jgi:hypothetical protein
MNASTSGSGAAMRRPIHGPVIWTLGGQSGGRGTRCSLIGISVASASGIRLTGSRPAIRAASASSAANIRLPAAAAT